MKMVKKKAPLRKAQAGGAQGRIDKRVAKNEAKKQLDIVKGQRKAIQTKAKEESKTIKTVNKNTRSKIEGYESTADKRKARAKTAQGTIGAARSSERNVNVKGDRRLVGSNTTVTKTDNSTTDKSTNVSQEQKQQQKQKQNTGSNNRSSDNRRGDTTGPRPKRPIDAPTNPKRPVDPIKRKGPGPKDPMTRKQIEDMVKKGKYVTMSRGGTTKRETMKIKQKGGIGSVSAKPRPRPKPKSPVRAPLINIVTPEKNPKKRPNTLMPVPPKYPSLARKGGVTKKYQAGGKTISEKAATRKTSKGKGFISSTMGPNPSGDKGAYIPFTKRGKRDSKKTGMVSNKEMKPSRKVMQKGGTKKK